MENYEELKATKLFSVASEFECQAMMYCLKTRFKTYKKNEYIVSQDDPFEDVILVLKGECVVETVDSMGNISAVMRLKKGDVFGAELAFAKAKFHKDNLLATEKTLVLFMDKHRLITMCDNRCKRHEFVIKNLMEMVADSNAKLLEKLGHMSKRTTREKLLSYLTTESNKANSNYFTLSMSKTELAEYLGVDRSAMSWELTKLREDGIIDFDKREFHIIKK